MTPAEVIVVCFVYVAVLILGQRAAAFLLPEAQEIGFVLAAVVGSLTAAVLYHSREKRRAPWVIIFGAGAYMAVLALVVGMATQLLWQPFLFPSISLPVAAVMTLLLPFVLFTVGRKFSGESGESGGGAGGAHILVAVTMLVLVCVGAWAFPAPGKSNLRLAPQTFPGLTIELPDWRVEEKKTSLEAGTVKLADPVGGDHFISLRWTDSDPVQPDEYIKPLASAGSMTVKDRSAAIVGGHEGATYYLEGSEGGVRAAATVWNCPKDHRVMWIFTTISGPKASMLASHQKIVESVHCHTGSEKAGAGGQKVFPGFTPPPGFSRQQSSTSLVYTGPRRQTILFDAAVPGRSDLVAADLSPDQAAAMLKGTGSLTTVEGTPQLITVTDLSGHERRVWTATGAGADGGRLQVEVMVWWCDQRDMTFIGAYATQGAHDPREGVNTLLPAVCH
jgi:hypothetical protein